MRDISRKLRIAFLDLSLVILCVINSILDIISNFSHAINRVRRGLKETILLRSEEYLLRLLALAVILNVTKANLA